MKTKALVGDWIAFYNSERRIVISDVRYIEKQEYPYTNTYYTSGQAVKEDDILEVRQPEKKGEVKG